MYIENRPVRHCKNSARRAIGFDSHLFRMGYEFVIIVRTATILSVAGEIIPLNLIRIFARLAYSGSVALSSTPTRYHGVIATLSGNGK